MRKVLVLAGLALVASGCGRKVRDEDIFVIAKPGLHLEMGTEVGRTRVRWLDIEDGDEWNTIGIRPFMAVGLYGRGVNWDLRVRGQVTTVDEVDTTSVEAREEGTDFRYRLGWGWELGAMTIVSVLTGPSYRHGKVKFSNTNLAYDPLYYSYGALTWGAGGRWSSRIGKRMRLFVEGFAEYAFEGGADVAHTSSESVSGLERGYVLSGRSGLELHQVGKLWLGLGAFGETYRLSYEGDWDPEDDFLSYGLFGSLIIRY